MRHPVRSYTSGAQSVHACATSAACLTSWVSRAGLLLIVTYSLSCFGLLNGTGTVKFESGARDQWHCGARDQWWNAAL